MAPPQAPSPADLVLARVTTAGYAMHRWFLPATGAITGLTVWSGQLAGLAVGDRLGWPVELWSGVVLVSAALGGVLGALATAPMLDHRNWVHQGQPMQ
ncbi:MAG: hypothetical protein ABR608_08660 [Pseudonocardiaceae bacterium]